MILNSFDGAYFLYLEGGSSSNEDCLSDLEIMAREEALDTVAKNLTREVIQDAMDSFPDLTNQNLASEVAMEILQTENADWMKQGSGDSGIGSTDSPQQG